MVTPEAIKDREGVLLATREPIPAVRLKKAIFAASAGLNDSRHA